MLTKRYILMTSFIDCSEETGVIMESVRKHIPAGDGGIHCCPVGAIPLRPFHHCGYYLHICCRTVTLPSTWNPLLSCMPMPYGPRLLYSRHWDKIRRKNKGQTLDEGAVPHPTASTGSQNTETLEAQQSQGGHLA